MAKDIQFSIEQGDITTFEADVIALKYAQSFHGADQKIADLLEKEGVRLHPFRISPGHHRILESHVTGTPRKVLFIGVSPLRYFRYHEIRNFASTTLRVLFREEPGTRHLAMTIHGAGYGLDEIEAFMAQLAGYYDAMREGLCPEALERLSIVEISSRRVTRLRDALKRWKDKDIGEVTRVTSGAPFLSTDSAMEALPPENSDIMENAGVQSDRKPTAFVAMPFSNKDDVYYYGIEKPLHALDFLCERIDQQSFTGDVMDQIKKRIDASAVVIAELSGANPNVYLEVGYAWGRGKPTILLVEKEADLCFDTKGQRCLIYKSIRDLETTLSKEMSSLIQQGLLSRYPSP